MNLISVILETAGSLISLYAFVCIARVFITWIPSFANGTIGRLLAQICDPWMNIFRRAMSTKYSRIDFSSIIAIGILLLISSILHTISLTPSFSFRIIFGIIFSLTLEMIWQIVSFLVMFFTILVLIRLIAVLLNKNTGSLWLSLDQVLNPVVSKVMGVFSKNRIFQQKFALLITLVCGILIKVLGDWGISALVYLF